MIPLPPWLTLRMFKIGGVVLLLAAMVGAFMWYRHSLIVQGRAETQAKWNLENLAEKAVADAQILKNATDEAAAKARNEIHEAQHAKALAAARADNARTASLLQRAREASCSAAKETDRQSDPAPASQAPSTRPPDGPAELDRAVADLIEESRANASQLDELIAEIRPQL